MNTVVTTNVSLAAQALRNGEVVAVPTETVYGLAARIDNEAALRRIFVIKGRPADNPLIVHVASSADVLLLAREVNATAEALMAAFWPGPLTLVLPKQSTVSDIVTAGLDSVAVRCPAHPLTRKLIAASGAIAAPSANLSGRPSPTTAAHVLADLDGLVPIVLDGGACTVGVESTIVDCTVVPVRVLRVGGVPLEALQAVVPDITVQAADYEPQPKAPGLKYRHYAPRATVKLFERLDDLQRAYRDGDAVLCFNGEAEGLGAFVYEYGDAHDGEALARHLFDGLRTLDALPGVSRILARVPADKGLQAAVVNRLQKAATMRLIVGLTGPIGSGKSLVASVWAEQGVTVLDCDRLYHQLLAESVALRQAIFELFPSVNANGSVDRKALGQIVFRDKIALSRLEAVTHPAIMDAVSQQLAVISGDVAIEAIALFESRADVLCDATVCVTADESLRLQRVMARDGSTLAQAQHKSKAQPESQYYEGRADYILRNNGNEQHLRDSAINILQTIRRNHHG